MKLIKRLELNCECFDDLAKAQGITINSRQDDIDKSTYGATTKEGRDVIIIETSKFYDCDAYISIVEIYEK